MTILVTNEIAVYITTQNMNELLPEANVNNNIKLAIRTMSGATQNLLNKK